MKQTSGRGFTLIELLVVIAIIGILASIVLASLNSARTKSRDTRRLADMKQIQTALELYYSTTNNSYPPTNSWVGLRGFIAPTFMSALPNDPTNSSTYVYTYQATNGAATPGACAAAPCQGYLMRAQTEVASYMPTAVAGVGTVPSSSCDNSPAGPPHDYCIKI